MLSIRLGSITSIGGCRPDPFFNVPVLDESLHSPPPLTDVKRTAKLTKLKKMIRTNGKAYIVDVDEITNRWRLFEVLVDKLGPEGSFQIFLDFGEPCGAFGWRAF